jgi:hypothetical protein
VLQPIAGFCPTPFVSALAGDATLAAISAAAGITDNVVRTATKIRVHLFTYNLRSLHNTVVRHRTNSVKSKPPAVWCPRLLAPPPPRAGVALLPL